MHPSTLISVNNLAGLYSNLGDYEQAKRLYERALQSREQTLGADHPKTLTSVGNLGFIYRKLQDNERAEPLYRRALEAKERTLGVAHPRTITSVNNLAWLNLDLGRADEAGEGFLRCLESRKDPSKWIHHWTKLGLALSTGYSSGDFAAVEGVILDLVELLGADHKRLVTAREKLEKVQQMRNQNLG